MNVPGKRLLDRLLADRHIDAEQHQRALHQAQRLGDHCQDAIIDVGAISEADVLRYAAGIYRTRFVTSEKLSKAIIDAALLRKIPERVAEQFLVFPILFDRTKQELAVVAADFEEHDIVKQVQLVSGARQVSAYLARPAAVKALINKHYRRDARAFARLRGRAAAGASAPLGEDVGRFRSPGRTMLDSSPAEPRRPRAMNPAPRPAHGTISEPAPFVMPSPPSASSRPPIPLDLPEEASSSSMPPAGSWPPGPLSPVPMPSQGATIGLDGYLETVNVLVALLEQDRGELRGHSAEVGRLCRRLCERIGLDAARTAAVVLAAYLHDIGKSGTYHLTALNVGQYEGHRIQAKKAHLTGVRMLESAQLPAATVEALEHMYERYDGNGFPDRLSGKEIPLGARMIAIAETYSDLTTHPKNPYRKTLGAKEACEVLVRYKGAFFDPNMVDVFQTVVLGDEFRSKLLADRPAVLIVDTDPEESTVLELRLVEQGFDVIVKRSPVEAVARLAEDDVDILITEVDLGSSFDGFALVAKARETSPGLPVMFLSAKSDGETVNRCFELGKTDFLSKPASADIVAAKLRVLLSRGRQVTRPGTSRGVSGSLREMSLPDVLQILANGRKSGGLEVRSGGDKGEILFSEGAIWDASFGQEEGPEAVYAMLLLEDGTFMLDPDRRPTERKVHESAESLLLEGMRRLDEGRR